jgi:hypothetical protein
MAEYDMVVRNGTLSHLMSFAPTSESRRDVSRRSARDSALVAERSTLMGTS